MVISAPGGIKGRKEKRLVSLVDMLPTFVDLGSENDKINPVDKIDGKSLAPMLYGEKISDPDEVMIEFTAEGTFAPALILRSGALNIFTVKQIQG
jgi:choline-sulfatase